MRSRIPCRLGLIGRMRKEARDILAINDYISTGKTLRSASDMSLRTGKYYPTRNVLYSPQAFSDQY